MKAISITRRLLLGVLVPLIPIMLSVGYLGYLAARFEINEVYDAQLATAANFLRYYGDDVREPTAQSFDKVAMQLNRKARVGLQEYTRWRRFRVWHDGHLVYASSNASSSQPPLPPGYSDQYDAQGHWRFFTLYVPDSGEIVEAGENAKARGELIQSVMLGLILPLSFALPLIALASWRGIVWGLKDLRGFAASVRERSADNLAPLDTERTPAELRSLSASINGLMDSLSQSLDQERLFADNAAHELRTPLAAIRAQAEVVSGARNASERKAALAEMNKGVDRASRLMEQLLVLARLRQTKPPMSLLILSEAATEALHDLYFEAEARGIGFCVDGDREARVSANPLLLGVILRNLIDNAIKYAPEGSDIDIITVRDETSTRLDIRDRGPGIPEEEREKVFARFYRVKGTRAPGSGLGLAIVRIAAARMGCRIRLSTPRDGQGLIVSVAFLT